MAILLTWAGRQDAMPARLTTKVKTDYKGKQMPTITAARVAHAESYTVGVELLGCEAHPALLVQDPCASNADNFDKAGEVIAGVARWTYNSSSNAYEFIFSDEHQAQAQDLLTSAKKKARQAAKKEIKKEV
jgi:hypothetical protein